MERKKDSEVQVVCGSPQVFSPTYLPPGLMTMALLLRVSSSTWAMLSLAFWYESSVAQTVILSWMPPKQSSWTLPSLVECREGEIVSRVEGAGAAGWRRFQAWWQKCCLDGGRQNILKRVFVQDISTQLCVSTAQAAATWLATLSPPHASLCGGDLAENKKVLGAAGIWSSVIWVCRLELEVD